MVMQEVRQGCKVGKCKITITITMTITITPWPRIWPASMTITITMRQVAGFSEPFVGRRLDETIFTSLTALTTVDYF